MDICGTGSLIYLDPCRAKRGVAGAFTLAVIGRQRQGGVYICTTCLSVRGARVGGSMGGGPCQQSLENLAECPFFQNCAVYPCNLGQNSHFCARQGLLGVLCPAPSSPTNNLLASKKCFFGLPTPKIRGGRGGLL